MVQGEIGQHGRVLKVGLRKKLSTHPPRSRASARLGRDMPGLPWRSMISVSLHARRRRDRGIREGARALLGDLIDNVQDAEATTNLVSLSCRVASCGVPDGHRDQSAPHFWGVDFR
jgi:hypothetical protein